MRIHLMLISALLFTFPVYAKNYSFEDSSRTMTISILKDDSYLKINYCFIMDNGLTINCMDNGKFQSLMKYNNFCYSSKKVINTWNGEDFELSICKVQKGVYWNATPSTNIPEKVNFQLEN